MPPLAGLKISQVDIHDSHSLQALRLVSERGAHAADLPIQSLREDDAKALIIDAGDFARFGDLAHDFHALR